MTTGRTENFSPEEDMQIIALKARRFTYPEIAKRLLTGRTAKSIACRWQRLEKNGEASLIRKDLIEKGATGWDI